MLPTESATVQLLVSLLTAVDDVTMAQMKEHVLSLASFCGCTDIDTVSVRGVAAVLLSGNADPELPFLDMLLPYIADAHDAIRRWEQDVAAHRVNLVPFTERDILNRALPTCAECA